MLGPKLDARAKLRTAVGNGSDPAALGGGGCMGLGLAALDAVRENSLGLACFRAACWDGC